MTTIKGRTNPVSTELINMPGFVRMVLSHVPVDRIDAKAFALLRATLTGFRMGPVLPV